MDTFAVLLKEITTKQNFLTISLIEQINSSISHKLISLFDELQNTNNKYFFVSGLVKLGYELEKSINTNSLDILSLQMYSISGLIKPIVSRIKKICYELNLELVEDLKKYVQNYIENETSTNLDIKKHIKFMNINCFCRNVNYVISKELMFEDFGIVVKISNPHYKNIFAELVESIGIFTQNNIKDKRFDWCWKALCDYDLQHQYFSISIETSIETNELNKTNINKYKNIIQENKLFNDLNLENENNTILEEFKIVQKIPENIIGSTEKKPDNKLKIMNQTNEKTSKILSNSIIIEDESFSIQINENKNDYSTYSEYNN